jgi:hypothetical protein
MVSGSGSAQPEAPTFQPSTGTGVLAPPALATATALAPMHAPASAPPWRLPGDLHLNHQDPVVPAHLLTREAGKGYKNREKPSS